MLRSKFEEHFKDTMKLALEHAQGFVVTLKLNSESDNDQAVLKRAFEGAIDALNMAARACDVKIATPDATLERFSQIAALDKLWSLSDK